MPPRHLFVIPPDAPVLCGDLAAGPAERDRHPRTSTRPARRRWLRIQHRRCRRAVRGVFGVRRGLTPLRPAWRALAPFRDGAALCSAVTCRHHLVDFYNGVDAIGAGCALEVEARGEHTQEQVGVLLGISRQAVQQVETAALARRELKALKDEKADPRAVSLEDCVWGALRASGGDMTAVQVAKVLGTGKHGVKAAIAALHAAGRVRLTARGAAKGGGERYAAVDTAA